MTNEEEKLVVFGKYPNRIDADIIKGALEASGIIAGTMSDSVANALLMTPIKVMVFRRDLEEAIKAIDTPDLDYEDYKDEMTREEFDRRQQCTAAFFRIALKWHPELPHDDDKQARDLYEQDYDALEGNDLATLTAISDNYVAD